MGHTSIKVTMDLYGHLIDRNLWKAAARVGAEPRVGEAGASGGTSGARTTAQLSESLATDEVEIPDEIIQALDDVSAAAEWENQE